MNPLDPPQTEHRLRQELSALRSAAERQARNVTRLEADLQRAKAATAPWADLDPVHRHTLEVLVATAHTAELLADPTPAPGMWRETTGKAAETPLPHEGTMSPRYTGELMWWRVRDAIANAQRYLGTEFEERITVGFRPRPPHERTTGHTQDGGDG